MTLTGSDGGRRGGSAGERDRGVPDGSAGSGGGGASVGGADGDERDGGVPDGSAGRGGERGVGGALVGDAGGGERCGGILNAGAGECCSGILDAGGECGGGISNAGGERDGGVPGGGEHCGALTAPAPFSRAAELAPDALPPLVLAFVGDAVYELFVRAGLAASVQGSVNRLHRRATEYARSASQADVIKNIQGLLTEKEREIVRRGRNAKSGFVPKNADVVEYRHATGFEALLGYLYLQNESGRLLEIMNMAAARVEGRLGGPDRPDRSDRPAGAGANAD